MQHLGEESDRNKLRGPLASLPSNDSTILRGMIGRQQVFVAFVIGMVLTSLIVCSANNSGVKFLLQRQDVVEIRCIVLLLHEIKSDLHGFDSTFKELSLRIMKICSSQESLATTWTRMRHALLLVAET
nr:hypothetical protein CFP56_60661 [Quercus suber]